MNLILQNENAYLNLLKKVVQTGRPYKGRNGEVLSLFGERLELNLRSGFPLLTTKKVHFKSVMHELLWFLRGDTNVKSLHEHGVTIWDEWADENGDLGPIYGLQWRDFQGTDQIKQVEHLLQNDSKSRRMIVSAWNPPDIPKMGLPPCHVMWQLYAGERYVLSMQVYMRSCDIFLGLPFNIASYALLLNMFCRVHSFITGKLMFCFGDLHLYELHYEAAEIQLYREPFAPPRVTIHARQSVLDIKAEDIVLTDYHHHPAIKAKVIP